jgi:hypothetical protein
VVVEVEPEGGVTDDVEAARVVGGGEEDELLDGFGEPAAPVEERLLDPVREVQLGRQCGRSGELGRVQLEGELEERQRVATGLAHQPGDDTLGR